MIEGKNGEALKTVEKALELLSNSYNSAYQIETLLTKSKILIQMDNFVDSTMSMIEAVNLARIHTGEDSAKRVIEEFEKALNMNKAHGGSDDIDEIRKPSVKDDFELILPENVAHYSDYRGIWINNDRLAEAGLNRGSLAIVARTSVKRGDLAAILELDSGQATCGFYDAEFGIVCLESSNGDPHVFNEDEVKILGKIIGVCQPDTIRRGGKLNVEAL